MCSMSGRTKSLRRRFIVPLPRPLRRRPSLASAPWAIPLHWDKPGVRIAMGAEREDILWLASRHGLRISAAAFAIGLPASIAGARFLAGLIYGTSPGDPVVFAGLPIILFAAVLTAGYVPAHRATRV